MLFSNQHLLSTSLGAVNGPRCEQKLATAAVFYLFAAPKRPPTSRSMVTMHRHPGGPEADYADFVQGTAAMLLFCVVFDAAFSRAFSKRSETFRENGLMLAANTMLAISLRLPSLSPFSYGHTVAIIFGFEVFEFARYVRRGRTTVSAGSAAALLAHHGGCVVMGIATLAVYSRLPASEVAVWEAMWAGLAPMTTSSVFLGLRLLVPGAATDSLFALVFIYTRMIEAPREYWGFYSEHGSFGQLARLPAQPTAACCILGVWTLLDVLNFYWGMLLMQKMTGKLRQSARKGGAKGG